MFRRCIKGGEKREKVPISIKGEKKKRKRNDPEKRRERKKSEKREKKEGRGDKRL